MGIINSHPMFILIKDSEKYESLYTSIFNPIKYAVDLTLIELYSGGKDMSTNQVYSNQFHCPGYDDDIFKTNFAFLSFVIITTAFLFTLVVNLGQIIMEKESKMKVSI